MSDGQWTVISLPAIRADEEGNDVGLWPEFFPLAEMQLLRGNTSPRTWSALYMQTPKPDGGLYFDESNFRERWEILPAKLTYYITADFAVKESIGPRDDPDFTEIGTWGISTDGKIYAVDWWYGQSDTSKWLLEIVRLMKQWRPHKFFGEGGVIRHAIQGSLKRLMLESRAHTTVEWLNPISDKQARARAFQGFCVMERVVFPKKAPWLDHVMSQLLSFPAGHDDAVDACSLIGLAIEQLHNPVTGVIDTDEEESHLKTKDRHWRVV